jgi:arylsulfatase A-like enzyme
LYHRDNPFIDKNMKKKFLLTAALAALISVSTNSFGENGKKPNILFILTDDQAPWAFSASGDPNAHTPVMDELAKQGAYIKNAFITTPVCSPSRASIMTSRWASEYNILDFIPHPDHSLFDPLYKPGLDPESITFAEVLQQAGYKTGLVGKWHLGDWTLSGDKKYHPTNHGFDYFMGLTGGGTSPDDPELEINGEVKHFKGLTTDILADHAMEFIKKNANRPFLLCYNTRAPHGRWLPVADEDWFPFDKMDPVLPNPNYPDLDKEKAKRRMREYLASAHGVDRNIGRITELLKELGLYENTVIIFFSDHGYNMGHNGIEHKGNGIWITKTIPEDTGNIAGRYRPNLFDNSLKVPAFVYWPGVIEPGTVIENTISSLDLYPTIVEIAGADLPKPNKHIVRGRSIAPLLKGENIDNWDNDFYSEYSMINYCTAFMRSYRTPEWKLVRDFMNPERDELYHIALDPEENINLINDSSDKVREIIDSLHQKIIDQMKIIDDPLLNEVYVDKYYYK